MPEIGVPELLIIAFVVLLLFGPGKAADLGSSLGKGIREFRRETTGVESPSSASVSAAQLSDAPPATQGGTARFCTECGSRNLAEAKFCADCGKGMMALA